MINIENLASDYIKQNNVDELLEDLCTALCYHQPSDLELKKKHGFKSGIFTEEELSNIFQIFDLENTGKINQKQLLNCLNMVISNKEQEQNLEVLDLPVECDFEEFRRIVKKFVGI